MSKGKNLADPHDQIIESIDKLQTFLEHSASASVPCIFISHKKEDSAIARELADFITDAGINIFFDERNTLLNDPEVRRNPTQVTSIITEALQKSDYMVCVISEKTKQSWWVPFEIGFAWEKVFHNNIVAFCINDITELPEYLIMIKRIERKGQLLPFIQTIKGKPIPLYEQKQFSEHSIFNHLK